jgi:heme O synthase-like polyprenyltransferase
MLLALLLSPILTGPLFDTPLLLKLLLVFAVGVWLLLWARRLWREGQRTNAALMLLLSLMGLAFPFVLIFLILRWLVN